MERTTRPVKEPERLDDKEEVDRIAEAVLVLRRSGLFSVEPIENKEESPFKLDGHFDLPDDEFVCHRRGRLRRHKPVLYAPCVFRRPGKTMS